jgi:hypothetical protein
MIMMKGNIARAMKGNIARAIKGNIARAITIDRQSIVAVFDARKERIVSG